MVFSFLSSSLSPPPPPTLSTINVTHITPYDPLTNSFTISPHNSAPVKTSKKNYVSITFKDPSTNKIYKGNLKIRNLVQVVN